MVKISVIMGAYNCDETISEALNSLLNQTYQDFEIIICDDGSVDNTYNLLLEYKESNPDKFVVLKNEKNMGLNFTLNKCLNEAQGAYIARMDADDLSVPDRFEKQNNFLDNNPQFGFVSANMLHFDENGEWGISKTKKEPKPDDFVYNSPFPHPPVMIRKEAYKEVRGYTVSNKLLRVEDYHLWVKLYAAGYYGYNIQEPLVKHRDDQDAYNRRTFRNRINGMYVRIFAINELKLSKWKYIYSVRPILVGLLPKSLYTYLHKKRLKRDESN